MQNHSIYQAVRTNCKILNSLSHKMSTESNASGGSGPHFLNAGIFRMAFRCPQNSPAVHKRNQYKVQAQSLRVLEKEGTTQIVQPKPLTLPMRMLRPLRWHVQGQMAINVQPTSVPTSPTAPAPKLPSTPSYMNDSLGHSILLRKYSNFTSGRKANCKWGEEGYKS